MPDPAQIELLCRRIEQPEVWKWRLQGWLSRRTYPIVTEVREMLTQLDAHDPATAQALRERLRRYLLTQTADEAHLQCAAAVAGISEKELRSRMTWLRKHGLGAKKHAQTLAQYLDTKVAYLLLPHWDSTQRLLQFTTRERMDEALTASQELLRTKSDLDNAALGIQRAAAQFTDREPMLGEYTHALLANALPACKALIAKEGVLPTIERLNTLLRHHDPGLRVAFLRGIADVSAAEDLEAYLEIAQSYYERLERSTYALRLIEKNLPHLSSLGGLGYRAADGTRMGFSRKDVPDLRTLRGDAIPLGGRLTGYIVRIVRKNAFTSWRSAYEAGIPTEEILKNSRGEYRVRQCADGRYAVITCVAGEQYSEYAKKHPELKNELQRQKMSIMHRLRWEHIAHHDLHDGNFVVEEVLGKPVVRVIDFELSTFDTFLPRTLLVDLWTETYRVIREWLTPKRPRLKPAEETP